jgi:hypothetical protein
MNVRGEKRAREREGERRDELALLRGQVEGEASPFHPGNRQTGSRAA